MNAAAAKPMDTLTAPMEAPVDKGFLLWDLDPRDTAVLKALAIAGIVLHNFFHAVSPARQNEFTFDPQRWMVFLHTASQPVLALQAFFSFFGHFGVQIFVFLSAYGLAKSHWADPAGWTRFMAGRVRKLYPAFGLIVVPWVILISLQMGPLTFLRHAGLQIAMMLVGLSPFMPGYGLPPVGPWWFIAFILEFYAMWLLLRKLTVRFGWPGLLVVSVVCTAVTAVANPLLAHWSINLLETPIGRMPVLCFGIFAARYPVRIPAVLGMMGGVILLVGSANAILWPFTSMAALMLALWLYANVRGSLRGYSVLERIGNYSVLIFLLNGIVRNQFIALTHSPGSQLMYGALSAAVSVGLSALLYELVLSRPRTISERGPVAVARTSRVVPAEEKARPFLNERSPRHFLQDAQGD
jgi:peptidoglycan/LPS O-acetylase OafA/YrhL